MTDTLPELPDEDGDFTPNLARAIMEKYRELLAGRDAEIERLTRENEELRAADRDHLSASRGMETRLRAEVDKERKRADDNFDAAVEADRCSAELKARALAAESSLSEAVKAAYEDAAKIAEAKAVEFLSPEYATGQPFSSFNERFACKQVASAIRSRAAVLDSERGSTHEA